MSYSRIYNVLFDNVLYCNVIENWPSSSPDLNPIENVWAIMKRKVKDENPHDIAYLLEVILKVWYEHVTEEMVCNLIDSMPSRLKEVINKNGNATGY